MKELKNDENKVWVTVSFTTNLGNYESLKVEAGYSKTYTTEEPLDLMGEIADTVLETIAGKVKTAKRKYGKKKTQ